MALNKQELALGLIELWDEYLLLARITYPPTMTDFMRYIKDHCSVPDVKETRTSLYDGAEFDRGGFFVMPEDEEQVNSSDSVAEQRFATLDKKMESRIRELAKQGYTSVRIRHMLNLDNVPLSRIIRIVDRGRKL